MPTKPFHYQEPFPLGPDTTEYQLITKDYVKVDIQAVTGGNPNETI